MNVKVDFSCLDTLLKKLDAMGEQGAKLENEALIKGAEIIKDEIVKNAPVRKVGSKNSKKYIKCSKIKNEKGRKVIKVGIQKEDNSEAFYLKFYEYGTSRGQIARPFMRPAFERKRKEALETTKEVIRKGLGL